MTGLKSPRHTKWGRIHRIVLPWNGKQRIMLVRNGSLESDGSVLAWADGAAIVCNLTEDSALGEPCYAQHGPIAQACFSCGFMVHTCMHTRLPAEEFAREHRVFCCMRIRHPGYCLPPHPLTSSRRGGACDLARAARAAPARLARGDGRHSGRAAPGELIEA
jgi:hypothetical protein